MARNFKLNATAVDVGDNVTNVSDFDSILFSVHVTTVLSAHALPINDGAGGTPLFTIPASAGVGSIYTWDNGVPFRAGISVDPDDAATGGVVLVWESNQ